jgi:hypothetical protein
MATTATETLDANDEVCGPVNIDRVPGGFFSVTITGTITVTLQRRIAGAWVPVEAGYNTSTTKDITGAGEYRLIASGTSGGEAACFIATQPT